MNLEQGVQVIDLFGLMRRRGKLLAVIAGGVILVTFWVAMALPNLYTSSAMILVEPQSVDEDLVNSGVRQSDLNERLGLMTAEILSRARLSKIITEMKLYENESKELQRQEVVALMRSFVQVVPVLSELEDGQRRKELKFNTFRITFQNEDKTVAAEVAQLIANDFIDANIKSRTDVTGKSLDFMEDEIASLTGQLANVESAIASVKADNAGRLPEEFDSNQRMMQFAMSDLRDAQRILAGAESDESYWKNQAISAASLGNPMDDGSPSQRIRQLEIERGNLVARGFTSRHPDFVRVEAEIALMSNQVRESAGEEGAAKSVAEQNALAERQRAELRSGAAREDIERLRASIAELEARLAGTASVAETLDGLNRQYDFLYRSYQDFSSRLQQASVQADMERRQLGEKFRILEPAEEAPRPSSPNRILLLSLGSILGLALGAGVALVAEVSDSSIHTGLELQQALGIPVLISVPQIMLESDRAERTRQNLRELAAVVAVVVFFVIGGLVTYVLVNGGGSEVAVEQDEAGIAEPARGASIESYSRSGSVS
jgi:polysaccharide chain length determinant protein (PEP-CTERM system associated)